MSKQDNYSDEHISAYIDGELDNEECVHLLFDSREDAELAQRIDAARTQKEKIQLAYADIALEQPDKHLRCTTFVSHHKSLAAGVMLFIIAAIFTLPTITNDDDIQLAQQLIKNTQVIPADKINHSIGTHKKTIINISQYQPQNFDAVIDNIESALLENNNDKSFHIEIVASKHGLRALDSDMSSHAQRITSLAKVFDNVTIIACAKSLAKLASEGDPVKLIKTITTTPSVAQQVAKRTGEGWLYLSI